MRNPFKRTPTTPDTPNTPTSKSLTPTAGSSASIGTVREAAIRAKTDEKRTEVRAKVTVGPEHAAILSKKLGRKVESGEEFDLGVVAGYDPDPIQNDLLQSEANEPHIFNDPIE